MRPTLPEVARKAIRFSPSRRTRTGGQSGAGSSLVSRAGIQYCRMRSPIGVPDPTRQSSSLSSLVSIADPPCPPPVSAAPAAETGLRVAPPSLRCRPPGSYRASTRLRRRGGRRRVICACFRAWGSSLVRTAMRFTRGAASRSSSSRLAARCVSGVMTTPVMRPPGRARLVTHPRATGSTAANMTMGTLAVVSRRAGTDEAPSARITSSRSWPSSRASAGSRSSLPSANRRSTSRFWPST